MRTVNYAGQIIEVRTDIPDHGRGMIDDPGLLAAYLDEKRRDAERQRNHDRIRDVKFLR
ncbi:MAG TPA: hypothetical protein VFK32_03990 [Tepidiformaceae bacterium]|nr:hypothetical protein [Tepidiformaceae bacterium]